VGTLAKMLAQEPAPAPGDTRTRRGLISICAAGGQGVVAILER
jgi:acetyl-CoA C-acetyltransferase